MATLAPFISPQISCRQILSWAAQLLMAAACNFGTVQAQSTSVTVLGPSWSGLSTDHTLEPPDPHGAAGPDGIIQVINTRIVYWNKNGTMRWAAPFDSFFPNSGVFFSDPRALYDPGSGRFFVEILALDFTQHHSFFYIKASKTSDPASITSTDWYRYRIENTRAVNGVQYWGDYSAFGCDGQALYLSLNLYTPISANPPYKSGDVQLTVLDKTALLNGKTNYSFLYIPGGSAAAFTLQPCSVIGTNNPGNVAYFAETFPAGSSTNVRIWALKEPLGARNLTSALVPVPDNGGRPPKSGAPQPGVTNRIDTLDGRTQGNAFWNNGALWFCATTAASSNRSQACYYQVELNNFPDGTPTLGEAGAIDGGPGVWTYQPSIGGNTNGDVCMVYCASSSHLRPTIFMAGQSAGTTSFGPPTLIKTSTSSYTGTRWGDYGSVSVDPTDSSFWVTHEWANLNGWSTWWANARVGTPPFVTSQPASQRVNLGGDATFSVTVIGTPPLSYQWLNASNAIAGATNSSLTLTNVQDTDGGLYSVMVTNVFGSVISSNATLRINHPPVAIARIFPLFEILPDNTNLFVLSPNNTNATVILDGSQSWDPDQDPLQFSWYADGHTNLLAIGAVAAEMLPLGPHMARLAVSDGLATTSAQVGFEIITPGAAAGQLVRLVFETNIGGRNKQPLVASLRAAEAAFDRGDFRPALNQLAAFQNQVQAQVTDASSGANLIATAQKILDVVGGSTTNPPGLTKQLTSVRQSSNGQMKVRFSGQAGRPFIVQASTNLVDWEAIGVAVPEADGTSEFQDTQANGLPTRFYRLLSPRWSAVLTDPAPHPAAASE